MATISVTAISNPPHDRATDPLCGRGLRSGINPRIPDAKRLIPLMTSKAT